MPVRFTYRIALNTSRKSVRAGSPVGRLSMRAFCQADSVGSISVQRASEMSQG